MRFSTAMAAFVLLTSCGQHSNRIPLSGNWQFTTDTLRWEAHAVLPGSMTTNGLGEDVAVNTDWVGSIIDSSYFKEPLYARYRDKWNIKVPFWLQPVKYYKGVAWYRRTVDVPEDWAGRDIEVFLERCHWKTELYVDGVSFGKRDALGVPHRYIIKGLEPGQHTIMLSVDNTVGRLNPGVNSHSISDHTQGNWNGVVGDMFIEAKPAVYCDGVDIFPDYENSRVKVVARIENTAGDGMASVAVEVAGNRSETEVLLSHGSNECEICLDIDGEIGLWDEFDPVLYDLDLTVEKDGAADEHSERFGFRTIESEDGVLKLNGRRIFLRGALDCAVFPENGYPPTDVDSWKKIMETCRDHGLNHIRFHSWCPPEAAFDAADELGMYLHVECSSWANQGAVIGDGEPLDEYILQESRRMVEEYGNHPSFIMMAYGNEPAGAGSTAYLEEFVRNWKERDPRRLYSTAGGWPLIDVNDFHIDPSPRLQQWGEGLNSIINSRPPATDFDWSDRIARYAAPVVSHEIGQWCVYPDFSEIERYESGVLRARNFEIFRETLYDNGMSGLEDDFLMASGKLQTLCYKADIEAALRTEGFGGFQLLGLSDFPGQGTALVGVLNAFWEEKGYVSPEEYRRFCSETVPLLSVDKLLYTVDERLSAEVMLSHFGKDDIEPGNAVWNLRNVKGETVASGSIAHGTVSAGTLCALGKIEFGFEGIDVPAALNLEIVAGGHANSWDMWVYENNDGIMEDCPVMICDRMDERLCACLENGGTAILSVPEGKLSGGYGGDIQTGFSSIFWNTAWTLGQAPHTLGILCDPEHPVFDAFPTENWSNYQWWDAMTYGSSIEFAKLSPDIEPLVRVIDDWFTNRPLALLFEVKVGPGRLIVSGVDFWNNLEARPAARQLLASILDYVASEDFNPQVSVSAESLGQLIQQEESLP